MSVYLRGRTLQDVQDALVKDAALGVEERRREGDLRRKTERQPYWLDTQAVFCALGRGQGESSWLGAAAHGRKSQTLRGARALALTFPDWRRIDRDTFSMSLMPSPEGVEAAAIGVRGYFTWRRAEPRLHFQAGGRKESPTCEAQLRACSVQADVVDALHGLSRLRLRIDERDAPRVSCCACCAGFPFDGCCKAQDVSEPPVKGTRALAQGRPWQPTASCGGVRAARRASRRK